MFMCELASIVMARRLLVDRLLSSEPSGLFVS